ncbi:MAG: hypothetical protein AAF648_09155, partial [Pseudomonadota bacterium]
GMCGAILRSTSQPSSGVAFAIPVYYRSRWLPAWSGQPQARVCFVIADKHPTTQRTFHGRHHRF